MQIGGPALESIIREIIESEYRAQKIVNEAEEERRLAAHNIETEIQKIKDDIFSQTNEKIETIRKEKLEYARSQAGKIIQEANAKASSMEKTFSENRFAWVECLLDNILGR